MTRATRLAATVLGLMAAACGKGKEDAPIDASGHIEATEVRISTKVAGTVEVLGVQEGDRVPAGHEIARIETTDARLALEAARAERAQADADMRLRLAGSRAEDIGEAEAQVDRGRAELEGAQRDFARMEGLLASGSGTEKARDDAKSRRDQAAANLEAARERHRKAKAGFRREEKDAARARVAAAEARIAQLEQQLADASVKAPVAGIVTEKLAEKGEMVTRGSALAVLADLDHPWLTVYVAEPDLGRIRLGQEAQVITDGGQQRTGRVTFVSPQAEFTPKNVQTADERAKLVYKVKIVLDNADGLFKPGMPAQARLRPVAGAAP